MSFNYHYSKLLLFIFQKSLHSKENDVLTKPRAQERVISWNVLPARAGSNAGILTVAHMGMPIRKHDTQSRAVSLNFWLRVLGKVSYKAVSTVSKSAN